MQKNKLPELLSPCGSPESLDAAVAGGADAVYLGGTLFNARMNARNFERTEITEAVKKCHAYGVKLYVTLNTLILDRELSKALEYSAFLYESGVDALIVTDIGFASLIKKYIPDIELHASTQATAHNTEAAAKLYGCGFSRVVCAREMSRDDIYTLCENSPAEIEVFVHGAICVSCSGQCLMSSMLGGRSGNRGECAQPCRMSYNGSYPISLKDLCLAPHIPELIDAGVASLKIEGRMKSPSYIYGVTEIYRRLLDERRAATKAELEGLARIFSRGGFTDAYFTRTVGSSMLGVRSERDKNDSRSASVSVKLPSKPRLPETVTVSRERPVIPDKFPAGRNNVPRRKPENTARFKNAYSVPDSHDFSHIYLPLNKFEDCADGVVLPSVIFDSERADIERKLEYAVKKGAKHVFVGNIGHTELAKNFGLIPHGDFRLNIYNTLSANEWAGILGNPESVLLSCELTLPQIRDISIDGKVKKGAVVYGRIPLMLLEKPVGQKELRDTRGARFPVTGEGRRDILLNSVPVYMADQTDRLDGAGIEERHFLFYTEDKAEALKIIYAYAHGVPSKDNIRRIKA